MGDGYVFSVEKWLQISAKPGGFASLINDTMLTLNLMTPEAARLSARDNMVRLICRFEEMISHSRLKICTFISNTRFSETTEHALKSTSVVAKKLFCMNSDVVKKIALEVYNLERRSMAESIDNIYIWKNLPWGRRDGQTSFKFIFACAVALYYKMNVVMLTARHSMPTQKAHIIEKMISCLGHPITFALTKDTNRTIEYKFSRDRMETTLRINKCFDNDIMEIPENFLVIVDIPSEIYNRIHVNVIRENTKTKKIMCIM